MCDHRPSPVIHDAMLDISYDLLAQARRLADGGGEGRLLESRAQCLGVLILVCSALEAAINVVAGAYYDGGPGKNDADDAGWPHKWFGLRGHSLAQKWTRFAPKIAGQHFADQAGPGWQDELTRVIRTRNEFIAHFKGRWAEPDAQKAFTAMSIRDAEHWFVFARRLIRSLESGHMYAHWATAIREQPRTPYPKPSLVHPFIEPIQTGSAGTSEMGFIGLPPQSEEEDDTKAQD